MKIGQRILVYGKVQGVWYRASTRRKALELGLFGFVRNEPDGSVYIEVSGTSEQVEIFMEWCKTGPELAIVKEIKTQEIVPKQFHSFEIA